MPMPRCTTTATRRTPRMDRQIQRVIAVLRQSPLTVNQIADALFIGRHSAGDYVRMLYAQSRIYVSGWQPTEANKPTRIYSVGNHPDVVYLTKRHPKGDNRAQEARERVFGLLALPQSARQVAMRCGLSVSRVRDLIAELKKSKRVHIQGWQMPEQKGSQSPVYAQGNKADCIRVRRSRQSEQRSEARRNRATSRKALGFVVETAKLTMLEEPCQTNTL